MKNVLNNTKKGFLMVMLFSTLLSFANEASFYKIKTNAKRTSLTLSDAKQGNILSIKDKNGFELYRELIQKSGYYSKGFDLTSLPDGDYTFELDKNLEIKIIPFIVKSNAILIDKAFEKTTFKPHVTHKSNLLFISKLATNLEPIKISIYADNNNAFELMHSEKIGGTNTIERVYKLEKGNYKITINSDNKEYTTFINN